MRLIIGLTGGIGCGKSAASQLFSELGIDVIDTDVISQRLTQPTGLAIPLIQKEFGKDFITADNALDRSKMRQLVFSNEDARLRLENILHPLILQETLLHIEHSHSSYIILVVPLLLENDEYRSIMAAQVSRQFRLQNADDVIVNNQDLAHLRTQVLQLHRIYLSLSQDLASSNP